MKIALYAPFWPPGSAANGIVTYASHLVPALRRLGHEVFVLTFRKTPGDADPYMVDLQNFSSAPNFWRRAMRRFSPETASFNAASSVIATAIRELSKKHKLDVFEIEESLGWSSRVSRLNLLPVVVRLHGPWFLTGKFNDPDSEIAAFRRRQELEGRGIQNAHFVTANCAETLNAVRDRYDLKLTRSRIIPTPIDAAASTETWDAEKCSKETFLFVGRFDRLKGGDLVLRAFAKLATSNPRLRLTFVGPDKGIKGDDGKILQFDDFVRANFPESIRSQIDFRGKVDHAELMSLRPKHFATVSAAQYDTMGYMVLEPLSLGCPLVTTAVGGIPEFVKDQRNGLLVPSQDADALAAACQKLLDDPALAARIGRQAWQDCRDLYGSENVARQTVAAYQEAIDTFKS